MTCATDSIRTGTAAADSPAYIDIAPMGRGVRVPQDRAELRGGELERSVSDEQQVAPLRRADEAEQGAEAVAHRPHDRLGDDVTAVREREPGRARARRAVLGDEHVARTQEQLDGRQ